jgi:hypothetical protein
MIKEPTMETNQGAQASERVSLMITEAQKAELRKRGYTNADLYEMKPADAHEILYGKTSVGLAKFVAIWRRDGFSEERIAQLTRAYLRAENDNDLPYEPPGRDEEPEGDEPETSSDEIQAAKAEGTQTTHMTTGFVDVTPDYNADEPGEGTERPAANSEEIQAAIDAVLEQAEAHPGNEPKRTRDAPRKVSPREGRPAVDINDPNVKRVLERYRPLSLQEIAQQKPPQWLLARHIPENSLVELFGEFATCKSFLALAWALSIAAGKPWLGQKVQQGHVVYVAEGTQGLRKRGLAWCKENGLDDFPENFHAIPRPVDMRDPNALDYVALAIKLALPKGVKPVLIVIDTLNRCFGGGDENSNQDMSGFINGCDALREEFSATVLVVHHSGKDRLKGSRGASALGGAMDVIFELLKPRRDQPLAVLRNNTNTTKPHKDSSPLLSLALDFVEIELDLEPDPDDPHANTSLVVRLSNTEPSAAIAKTEQATKRKTGAEETLDVIRSHKNGVTIAELMKVTGKARTTLNSRRDKLLNDGLIRQERETLIAVDEEELETNRG